MTIIFTLINYPTNLNFFGSRIREGNSYRFSIMWK